jgi:hypothetical protein
MHGAGHPKRGLFPRWGWADADIDAVALGYQHRRDQYRRSLCTRGSQSDHRAVERHAGLADAINQVEPNRCAVGSVRLLFR